MAKSLSNLCNTLPNNDDTHILIESKHNANLNLSNQHLNTSKFSNFTNYESLLESKKNERSKYFDVYYPNKEKSKFTNSTGTNSLNSSLSSMNADKSQSSNSTVKPTVVAETANSSSTLNPTKSNNSNKLTDEIKNFNLHANPVQFNMDKVNYVKTLSKAKSIVDTIQQRSKVISMNCDSDCCLQNGIDLLEVAVIYDESLDHPDIYVFDIYLEPKIIDLFKPVFANTKIVKVMFDARHDLRILSRKYGVTEFTALFDLQLAYRVLLAKLTNRPFEQVKREKLLYVSWQCNGPLVNFEKMYLPSIYYFKNRTFWRTRPVNFEMMYNAAYDVFVMLPQLFTNLMVIMERTLDEEHQQLFIHRSNDLILHNLVPRKFAFFHTKDQYLGEMHRQIDLLIQSDLLHRSNQLAKRQQQMLDSDYVEEYQSGDMSIFNGYEGGLKNQIHDIETDTYISFSNSSMDLMNSANGDLLFQSWNTNPLDRSTNSSAQSNHCENCKLPINRDKLGELLCNLKQTDSLKEFLFTGSKYCQCIQPQLTHSDEEAKCMNLLVDQIIDLAECKEDYMELDD